MMLCRIPQVLDRRTERRGAALFITILSVALLVSILALAGLALTRVERQRVATTVEVLEARRLARSGVEYGLSVLNATTQWRTTSVSGAVSLQKTLGNGSTGSLQWMIEDVDDNLANTDVSLRLTGIGRVGTSQQVFSVAVASSGAPGTEQILVDEFRPGTASEVSLQLTSAIGLTCEPTLPGNAARWSITRVAVWCRRLGEGTLTARVMTCDGLGRPDREIDRVTFSTTAIPLNSGWFEIEFPQAIGLGPSDRIAVILSGTAGSGNLAGVTCGLNSHASPQTTTVLTSDSQQTWTVHTDRDVWMKVYGQWTTSAAISALSGTWRPEAAVSAP